MVGHKDGFKFIRSDLQIVNKLSWISFGLKIDGPCEMITQEEGTGRNLHLDVF